jgi:hypothetical protein
MTTLFFIYNAESGLFNGALDWAHKIVSPNTYQCELCALTYGNFGEKNTWKKFIESLENVETVFYHKDEVPNQLQTIVGNAELPIVIKKEDSTFSIIVDKTQFASMKSLADLQNSITSNL